MIDHIFVSGFPGPVGGANTECLHTCKLWRKFGLGVTLIPTWRATEPEKTILEGIGCKIVEAGEANREQLRAVPGLPGAIVVSFCNSNFLKIAGWLREMKCKTVWLNCMTWLFAGEKGHYGRYGTFDRYVFQSGYQAKKLTHQLRRWGYQDHHGYVIRGAFSLDDWSFKPRAHEPGEPFVVGRVSRAAEDKWSNNTWHLYNAIPYIPLESVVMGWDPVIEKKLGKPPEWATVLPQNAKPVREVLNQLHCMVQINGGAGENWPRSGLEAMASGVPCIVQNSWGWTEMFRHRQTGYLCNSDRDLAFWPAYLANHEQERIGIALAARQRLESELANPEIIWGGWQKLLESLP